MATVEHAERGDRTPRLTWSRDRCRRELAPKLGASNGAAAPIDEQAAHLAALLVAGFERLFVRYLN